MCGINGFNFNDTELLEKMNKKIFHRGPDFSGVFIDENVSIGHNLLAIREVSEISKQPYKLNPKWVLSFNGQIYNTEKLKTFLKEKNVELEKDKENLDTYILYKLIEVVGFDFAEYAYGMYDIALYDTENKILSIYRDSSGQKNVYYYWDEGGGVAAAPKFIFSSEIKGILEHENLDKSVDEVAVSLALTLGYIPGDKTLFNKIKKIRPSEVVTYDFNTKKLTKKFFKPKIQNYFSNEKSFAENLNELMAEHLQAKGKISINLSGGLDSSLLLHEAKRIGYTVDSYTTSFQIGSKDQKNYNEDAQLAKKLSEDYGTKHKEIVITKKDYFDNFIESYKIIEEPNYNISLPVYLITAKIEGIHGDGKRVVLSGDGGDEVFGGYSYYLQNNIIDAKIKKFTLFVYNTLQFLRAKYQGKKFVDNTNILSRWLNMKKLHKFFQKDFKDLEVENYLLENHKNYKNLFANQNRVGKNSIYECMLIDRQNWMCGENFIRSDKLYMTQSLELRSPFAYEPFREYCDKIIPENEYINFQRNKIFLRNYAEGILPDYITHRENKTGWRAPIDLWYDESFKKLFLEIIEKAKNKSDGIIIWDEVLKRIEEKNTWPGKWVHLYLSLAIISEEFKLNL